VQTLCTRRTWCRDIPVWRIFFVVFLLFILQVCNSMMCVPFTCPNSLTHCMVFISFLITSNSDDRGSKRLWNVGQFLRDRRSVQEGRRLYFYIINFSTSLSTFLCISGYIWGGGGVFARPSVLKPVFVAYVLMPYVPPKTTRILFHLVCKCVCWSLVFQIRLPSGTDNKLILVRFLKIIYIVRCCWCCRIFVVQPSAHKCILSLFCRTS
jgi:hypothetical protein